MKIRIEKVYLTQRRRDAETIFVAALICLIQALPSYSQADHPLLRSGDLLFKGGAYTEAETQYRKALEEKQKSTSNYNLGNSIYEQTG
jgi:hypothetical protein